MICLELNLVSRKPQVMLKGPLLQVIMIGNLVLCPRISAKRKVKALKLRKKTQLICRKCILRHLL